MFSNAYSFPASSAFGMAGVASRGLCLHPGPCRRRRGGIAAVDASQPRPPSDGDSSLQDSLVRMVRLQIGQEKVKESVEEERQKLQELAEEAKAEVDRLQQLTMDRSNLAFGSALADLNKEADDAEEILRQSRTRMEAYSRELAEWEADTARARNEGTFFKGLFKADVLQRTDGARSDERGGGDGAPAPSTSGAQERRGRPDSRVSSSGRDNEALRASSGILMYSFGFLALVLFATSLADLLGGSPSLPVDGRNALLGLLLAYGAYKAAQYR